nr:MAG TPA: hypothetical protein [Caudoviricetes sp.]DAS81025.1 MAG TPA: hypothetical protein [Bacteriophage sp.]
MLDTVQEDESIQLKIQDEYYLLMEVTGFQP